MAKTARVLILCLALTFLRPAAARAMTPSQALSFVRPGDLHVSGDGSKLVFVVASYASDFRRRIRTIDLVTGAERELTPVGKSERAPSWSPDSRMLAFISNRAGPAQVFVEPAAGGEAVPITSSKQGVQQYRWSPDGRAIAFLANDNEDQSEDGPQVADRESDLARLWIIDLASGTTRRLGYAALRIDDFCWRDAANLLIQATSRPWVEEDTDKLYNVAIAGGAVTAVASPAQPFSNPLVSPDGKTFGVLSTAAHGPIARDLFLGRFGTQRLRQVASTLDRSIVDYRWQNSGYLWLRVTDGFYQRIFKLNPGGSAIRLNIGLSVGSFDVSSKGDVFFVGEDFTHLPEIYMRQTHGAVRQLTHLTRESDGIQAAPATIFETRSFDGTPIEATLIKPPGSSPKPPPLVLLVHGGPASNVTAGYGWQTAWADLLASHGYAVLMVNPRGSDGYREAFLEANRADWGGGDFKDLISVLDAVIARGDADPNRLGIGGWSYGGEMAAWAIGHTHRFKAAVFGAGVFDQQAEFETEDGPQFDEWYFGTPWEHPEVFARNSPASFIRNAATPTLILVGEDDQSNPLGQSKGLYRALKHFGVETQFVSYPGEGHSPRKASNNIDIFERTLAWYEAHLGPVAAVH
jgi:dipeptidyl aminopeptidase/acylaminoacyl peptidase